MGQTSEGRAASPGGPLHGCKGPPGRYRERDAGRHRYAAHHLILPPFSDRFTRRRHEGQRKQLALAHRPQAGTGSPRLLGAVAREMPNLARVVAAWPDLPAAIRRAVLALVGSAAS
jgi:hypothetical protein